MGACMDPPKDKKGKRINKKIHKQTEPGPSRPMRNLQDITSQQRPSQPTNHIIQRPKYKKMTIDELLITYKIQNTLQMSSKLQGPKYLSNIVDGSSKILRITTLSQIIQKRLHVYQQIIGFQVYQNDQGTLMILDDYCSGQDIYQLIDKFKDEKQRDIKDKQQEIFQFIYDVFKIISLFHKKKVSLGNLNPSSFKKVSPFQHNVQLVDFNLSDHVSELQTMGFAHKQGFQADFQFLGYLLQFVLSQEPPIFLPHKMQYIEHDVIPYTPLIQSLLKGRSCEQSELNSIDSSKILINQKMSLGYRFRRDINKLLKMRKKRKPHNRKFYGEDTIHFIAQSKFNQEAAYRYQTQVILNRIFTYVHRIRNAQQQSFLNYSGNNQNLRRLKQIFLITQPDKKMSELKDCLSTIK